MLVRTVTGARMNAARLCLAVVALQALLATTYAGHHRRSMPTPAGLGVSKGGWRPVVSSGNLFYGYGTAPLHAQYKLPLMDLYQASASPRPIVARDATKLTSIAQSYRPTTLRAPVAAPPANQPISTYLNPFSLPNNGLTHFKFVQNFPMDSVVIRNPHNPFMARPMFKYPQKFKQQLPNNLLQFSNVQPIQFAQYQTVKPVEAYKPVEQAKKPQVEVYKQEIYKHPDSDTASQSVSQQVKTVQQQNLAASPKPMNPFPHYAYQDALLPPSILGTFNPFAIQQVKTRDHLYPFTKTTFLPAQPTKQTIFNSFSFTPSYKTTPQFFTTTPKLQTTVNQYQFGTTVNDFQNIPTPQAKPAAPVKIDPNAGAKAPSNSFKPSPQDPFIKHQDPKKIAVTTYNPSLQTTTLASNYYSYNYPVQDNIQTQSHVQTQSQYTKNQGYDKKKQKIHDSVAAGISQQAQQYASPPSTKQGSSQAPAQKPTYEVTEPAEDIITHSSPQLWLSTPESEKVKQLTEESATNIENPDAFNRPTSTSALPEEYAIVTEAEKVYENSLSYDGHVESQSRRPLGDDIEPIGKHKLKDYYYKVSTPSYEGHGRRTKKPVESVRVTPRPEPTSSRAPAPAEPLPTLPPNQHFKRPSASSPEPPALDKDKIRKRNKIRRRRPIQGISNTTRKFQTSTETTIVTEPSESYTARPRVKINKYQGFTTPSVTTDLTTSALPTISPTAPTIVKKKLVRRPVTTTTTERAETTAQSIKDFDIKESPIMKITRPHSSKVTTPFEYKSSEAPDYTHKQDEKDTPTSDIAVNINDVLTMLNTTPEEVENFSFHRDAKPIDIREETTTKSLREEYDGTTTTARADTTVSSAKILRPRLKTKYDRPKFSMKDYRNRLSSTTSTTEKSADSSPRTRPPPRRPHNENNYNVDNDEAVERKKFMPKDPRHKHNRTENHEQVEKEIHSLRPHRQRLTTVETTEPTTQKISSRIRNGSRRPRPTEETTETSSPTTVRQRPLRKKVKDPDVGESVQDISVTDTTLHYDNRDITSERTRSESAIMKIADKKHQDHVEHVFEHSKRVSDLTLAASKDYNTPGMFKSVAANSRRIPNYFTIATDDPILPIEAFFPQLNQKKGS